MKRAFACILTAALVCTVVPFAVSHSPAPETANDDREAIASALELELGAEAENPALSLAATAGSTYPDGLFTNTVTASFVGTAGQINWDVEWADSSLAIQWEGLEAGADNPDKGNAKDYIAFNTGGDYNEKVYMTAQKPFGTPIILTAKLAQSPDITASCTLKFRRYIKEISLKMNWEDGVPNESSQFKASFEFTIPFENVKSEGYAYSQYKTTTATKEFKLPLPISEATDRTYQNPEDPFTSNRYRKHNIEWGLFLTENAVETYCEEKEEIQPQVEIGYNRTYMEVIDQSGNESYGLDVNYSKEGKKLERSRNIFTIDSEKRDYGYPVNYKPAYMKKMDPPNSVLLPKSFRITPFDIFIGGALYMTVPDETTPNGLNTVDYGKTENIFSPIKFLNTAKNYIASKQDLKIYINVIYESGDVGDGTTTITTRAQKFAFVCNVTAT